jgi:hypothetical protein
MERKFINYYLISVGLFLLWMVLRNQIWSNESLLPGDQVMIYARDSGFYFLLLMIVFLTFSLWASFLLWTKGKSLFFWMAEMAYSGILLLDNFILGVKYLEFKLVHEPWESAYPMSMFIGFGEAIFQILFSGFVVWLIKDSRKKRLARQQNLYHDVSAFGIQ